MKSPLSSVVMIGDIFVWRKSKVAAIKVLLICINCDMLFFDRVMLYELYHVKCYLICHLSSGGFTPEFPFEFAKQK